MEYFQSQGYFDAQVDFNETTEEAERQLVEFRGHPGCATSWRTSISGEPLLRDATLREQLFITNARFPQFPFGRFSQKMLDRA